MEVRQVIPDEAVEAALTAYDPSWKLVPGDWDQHFKNRMRVALEVAAPHMQPDLLEEWAVQFAIGSVEEADDQIHAERKLREIRECIADGIETPALEPMRIVRRYGVASSELTAWKEVAK